MIHKNPIQLSDQVLCDWCGKAWDVNDPDPPPCTEQRTSAVVFGETRTFAGRYGALQNLPRDTAKWPTPSWERPFLVSENRVSLLVWADDPEAAVGQARKLGLFATGVKTLALRSNPPGLHLPCAEANPAVLSHVRSMYPDAAGLVSPAHLQSALKKGKK